MLRVNGIRTTRFNINDSRNKRDTRRWFLFSISPIIDSNEHIIKINWIFVVNIYLSDNTVVIYNSQSYNFRLNYYL